MSEQSSAQRRIVSGSRRAAVLVAMVLIVAAPVAPAAADQEQPAARIVLRVYNVYGLSEADLDITRMTVREVFKAAGVQTIWRTCPGPAVDPCMDRPGANEIIVRLIRSPHDLQVSSADFTLGVSLVHAEPGRGSFTSVYPDRVGMLEHRFGRDHDLLLGRAIAHEVGHLLLGMTAHASSGLMRAHWSERPALASAPGDWFFSSLEARQLRDAARARATMPTPRRPAAAAARAFGAH